MGQKYGVQQLMQPPGDGRTTILLPSQTIL